MKKLLVIVLICLFALTGCTKEKESLVDSSCTHEWIEIAWSYNSGSMYADIYCPACKSEQTIPPKEWNKIQADMEYESKQGE